ncbi:MAG: radical SAM family heme chaperone HemW [Pseudomonadota bacterium]
MAAAAVEPNASELTPAANPDAAGFGVYVHWPFCAAKCPYCDFNSHVRSTGIDEAAFVDAFERDIARQARRTGRRTVTSIFFGGGTPSLMPVATVEAILAAIDRAWGIADGAEITLEANPTSVEAERFRGYRLAGINRVSLGVQSLRDDDLRALGRMHTAAEAISAVEVAQQTFDRISFDLITARPKQTVPEWRAELGQALALAADHLSLYQLTIEPGTPFEKLHAANKLIVPDPDLADDLYALTNEMTAAAGLPLYEISNHARPGSESQHNLLYWRYGEYVGIGPGAHGRPIVDGARQATSTERHPETWRDRVAETGAAFVETTPLTREDLADELLLMGLRLVEGVDLVRLQALGGVTLDPATVNTLAADGFLNPPTNRTLSATAKGRFVLNRLVLELSQTFVSAPGELA